MLRHNYVELPTGITMHYVEALPIIDAVGFRGHILLVHGFPDSWYGWRHQLAYLAKQGFHVLAPDSRGYGETIPVFRDQEQYRMELLCQDYQALLDILLIKKAIIIGHDWGGTLVWNFAAHFEHRVRGVASLCTPFFASNPKSNPWKKMKGNPGRFDYQLYFQTDEAEKELSKDIKRTVICTIRGVSASDQMGIDTDLIIASGGVPKPTEIGGYLKVFKEDIKRSDILEERDVNYYTWQFTKSGYVGPLCWYRNVEANWEWNKRTEGKIIQVPALMVTAEKDAILKPSMAEDMKRWFRHLTVKNVLGAGHFVAQEKPDSVNRILSEWLNKNFPMTNSSL